MPTRSGSRTTGRTTRRPGGLELLYERFLQGHEGPAEVHRERRQEIDRACSGEEPAVRGDDLVLTLEIDTQRDRGAGPGRRDGAHADDFDDSQVRAAPQANVRRRGRDGRRHRGRSGRWRRCPTFDPRGTCRVCRRAGRDLCGTAIVGAARSTGRPALVRARLDVQAVHRAGRRGAGLGALRQLLPVPARVRVSGRRDDRRSTTGPTRATSARSRSTALKVSCDTVFYQFGSQTSTSTTPTSWREDAQPLQRGSGSWGSGRHRLDLPLETTGLIPDAALSAVRDDHPELYPDGRAGSPAATSS